MRDIFEFWSQVPAENRWHPEDEKVFTRVSHDLRRDCLPLPFVGRLRCAPVVLLFLSPGFRESDVDHARSAIGQDYYSRQRSGNAALPSKTDHEGAWVWWNRIVRQLEIGPDEAMNEVAILNIGAYKSQGRFRDWHMLTCLPSSRVTLDWAQSMLFTEAELGKRVVVCLRSARLWGLCRGKEGQRYRQTLFAPLCTAGGIMHKGIMRDEIIAAVKSVIR